MIQTMSWNMGWCCPRCNNAYSPITPECGRCNNQEFRTTVSTGTTIPTQGTFTKDCDVGAHVFTLNGKCMKCNKPYGGATEPAQPCANNAHCFEYKTDEGFTFKVTNCLKCGSPDEILGTR